MKKTLSFIFAIILILSAFSGCTQNEKTDIDEPAPPIIEDDTEKGEEKTVLSLNSAFYPKYQSFSEYDAMREKLATWFMQKVESGEIFSATVGDVGSAELRARLEKDVKTSKDESGNTLVTATYLDGESGVLFKLDGTLYYDNPTVDYVLHVTNTSEKKKTPIIKNLYVLDTSFDLACDGEYTLHTNQGSNEKAKDFEPIIEKITGDEKEKHIFAPMKGSSSYDNAFPFFDVIGKDEGLILAIGWSGTWESEFAKTGDNTVNMKARQQNFNAMLLANETIRTPSIVLTYFDGDYDYGHNVWRRCVIEHYTPNDGSEDRFVAPMSLNTWGGRTAKSMIKCFEAYKEYDADLWWIDAGWYSQVPGPAKPDDTIMSSSDNATVWHQWLGVWSENRNLFPKGIKQVSSYIHEHSDLRFMLWWMIEDARGPKSNEFTFGLGRYYQRKNEDGSLAYAQALRLDDDKVADYLINYFKGYIDNKGLDCVRLDKSVTLAPLWEDYDARRSVKETGKTKSRKGITEAKYIENFYRVWDTLYEYHNGFLLDNCSSGGRRIDIEMTKRSIPLWRTDYSSYEEPTQAMTQYLSAWLPLTASGSISADQYKARSYYSACTCVSVGATDAKSVAAKKVFFDEFVELRPYWYGDYYQLMTPSSDEKVWQAYELYRADKHEGMAVAIRRGSATLSTQMLKLKGLVPDRDYKVHDIDDKNGETDIIMTGKELMERGIPARLAIRTIKCFEFSIISDERDSYYK